MASRGPGTIALPATLVVSAVNVAAELIRRCHAAGQPVPAGVMSTLYALHRAIAERGNTIGATTIGTVHWETTTEAAARSGIPERTIRHRAAAGRIPGARKVGQRWVIPSTATQ